MGLALLGVGTAVPPGQITQEEALHVAKAIACRSEAQTDFATLVHQHSGISTRNMVHSPDVVQDILHQTRNSNSEFLPGDTNDYRGPTTAFRMQQYAEHAAPLALQAARRALDEAGTAPAELTHLVTVSCTGFRAPGVDMELIKGLNLAPTILRTHLGFMGCHGALNGLRVANAFAGADPAARVLLCATELCSLHFQYDWNPQKVIANAIFADGSGAVVGSAAAAAPADAWQVAATGSCVLPDSAGDMGWIIGDHGFEMVLSKRVPKLITRHLRPWMEGWLAQHGTSVRAVGSWAVHPGGPMILTAVEEALSLPRSATAVSHEILDKFGNMSSPTVLFVLERLRLQQAPRPCVALGFGPGMAAEAVLFQ